MASEEGIKYFFSWVGQTSVKVGCRIGTTFYAQIFPRDTTLGDATDIVRATTVRRATGLDDQNTEPQQETF